MPDDRAPRSAAHPSSAPGADGGVQALTELTELRELLLGPERRQLDELRRRLDTHELSAEDMAEHLPHAITMRAARDRQLAVALAPTVERAITESVRRNPREIATAIFPVLGPSIRKAIAEAMTGLVERINRAMEHSLSPRGLGWRLESWRSGVPFAQIVIKHTLVYRVEQVFLIHAETGLLLAHAPEGSGDDANLVSSMLTAIRDFVADAFEPRNTGELRTFAVGDLCVLVEPGPQSYLAAVVRGQAAQSLPRTLQETLETIHVEWWEALGAFNGDTEPFTGTRPLLEGCLETVLARDQRVRRSGVARFAWILPVALALLALGWFTVRANRRWHTAVAALEAEPGIVLVRAERDWGRWKFAGLRDPLARDPAALLAALGADTASVAATWEPFVSTRPPLVLARARRILAPPPTVTLRLAQDTLVAEGVAPAAWIARAAAIGPALPGISSVALARVSEGLPAELEALRREAEGHRVLFDRASAALDSAARAAVVAFAAAFERLRRSAEAQGYTVTLRLIGRTDPTGTEARNQDLSQRRVDAVRAELAPLGVRALAAADALASSSPLPGRDEAERARLNRSVSFSVEARAERRAGSGSQ
ncbi:MAG: OmpA family protein [Gemmatimonadaceae bacterium]